MMPSDNGIMEVQRKTSVSRCRQRGAWAVLIGWWGGRSHRGLKNADLFFAKSM